MELLQDLDIHVEPVRAFPFTIGCSSPTVAFKWESVRNDHGQQTVLTEEQQRGRYRAYVERNIGGVLAEKELCVLGVEKDNNILTVQVPGRNIELSGRTDLLILSDLVQEEPENLKYLPGVKMQIEVKMNVEDDDEFQALSELIALDLLATDPVMALLSDLTNNWWFFWVSDMSDTHVSVHKTSIKEPGEAFQVITSLLAQSPTGDADICLPCF